uniref:EIF2B subunit epsilon/gamma LbH domain-containing protein n=1 Tax=Caenorhabditis japonica TaxID=281687 RepID=A0A8R1DIJ3_CAEJA
MTPPASAFKKAPRKEEPPLTAVVMLDVHDQRFASILQSYPCFGTFPIANVPVINFALSGLMRTEVKNVFLVVSGLNSEYADKIQKEWKMAFEEFNVVICDGAASLGDCMRELHNRELITTDFLLLSSPTCLISTNLVTQIAEFRKRRRESADNVMTLLYSHRENPEQSVIGVNSTTNKLMLFPAANSLNSVKAEKRDFYEGVDIRRDITNTGIAFCSRLIATQFSDNFDFVSLDDVVREILSKDDILGMSVHIDVMPTKERAFYAYDFESLVLLNTLVLERWFYPLVPETADLSRCFTTNPRNLYREEDVENIIIKAKTWILSDLSSTVSFGRNAKISYEAVINNSSIGENSTIESNTNISNCLIGRNCRIGANCTIENSFIGDNVTIPDGAHIQKESVIGNGVIYPKGLTAVPHSAIFHDAINEDQFDKISSQKIGSVHVAKLRSNAPFWKRSVNGRTNFSVEESESEGSDDEDDEDDNYGNGVDNSTRQFHDEVLESMQKILDSEDQPNQQFSEISENAPIDLKQWEII